MSIYHPSIDAILQYFDYRDLPPNLAEVSRPFAKLAFMLAAALPPSPELTVALRKLLESKDAAVRASRAPMSDALLHELRKVTTGGE